MRNKLFDLGILNEAIISLSSIGVGNLSAGGTGKSVVIDYLICLLKENHPIAVLSRGYKRKTKGVVVGTKTSTAISIGDEPFQFLKKHPDISVVVAEKRILGVKKIEENAKSNTVILLDDIMQHRYVKPSIMILTTTFKSPFFFDKLLPVGNLREPKQGVKRADIILVTKCPEKLSQEVIRRFKKQLSLEKYQQLFFTKIEYSNQIKNNVNTKNLKEIKYPFLVVTGIAEPKPLLDFLLKKKFIFEHISFPDHHNFSKSDLDQIQKHKGDRMIITTEKDYTRLAPLIAHSDLYYLPITMQFINPEEKLLFEKTILKRVD